MDEQGARPPLLCPEPATWNTELESQPDPGSSPYLSHFLAVWTRTNHCPSLSLHVLAGKMVQEHLPGTLVKQKGKAAIGPGPDPEQGLPYWWLPFCPSLTHCALPWGWAGCA